MDSAICCSRSIITTNDLYLRASVQDQTETPGQTLSIAWHGKKAELEKEGLTFAFALAYAAAHAGPKSGSSEEPT